MRRIVLWMSISLDGFMSRLDGDMSWQTVDEELHWHVNDVLSAADGFLEGRVTYELMADYWPTADQDPSISATAAEFAGIWRDMPKVVYSRTLPSATWATSIVREVVPEEVLALKAAGDGDLVLGGPDLAASFLAHDLVDELRLYVHPALIGEGKPWVLGRTESTWELEEAQPFSNGVVLLRYGRAT